MILIDIGSCLGEFIDHFLDQNAGATVYAFEPLEVNFNFLKDKYKGNNNVHVYKEAISNSTGIANFFIKENQHKLGNDGCSLESSKSNVNSYNYVSVKTIKLSTFIKEKKINKIDVLKIDVEGSEYDIFSDIEPFYEIIDKILYEDHSRKVPTIIKSKEIFEKTIKDKGILKKFFTEVKEGVYINLSTGEKIII